MNAWNNLVLGVKFLFGGFEAATDYLLELLNSFLRKGDIADRVQKARDFVYSVLGYLRKYEKYCPSIWTKDYRKLVDVVQTLVDVFEDGQVSKAEIERAIKAVQDAIAEWMK